MKTNWFNVLIPLVIASLGTWKGSAYLVALDMDGFHRATSTMLMVSVTFVGFLLTLVAIISALSKRKLIINMAKTGHLGKMFQRFFVAIFGFFVTVVLGIVIQITDLSNTSYVAVAFLWPFLYSMVLTFNGTLHFYNFVVVLNNTEH